MDSVWESGWLEYQTWWEGPWFWGFRVYMLHDRGITKLCFSVIRSWGPSSVVGLYLCSYTSALRYSSSLGLVNFSSKMVLLFRNGWTLFKILDYKINVKDRWLLYFKKLPNPISISSCQPDHGKFSIHPWFSPLHSCFILEYGSVMTPEEESDLVFRVITCLASDAISFLLSGWQFPHIAAI